MRGSSRRRERAEQCERLTLIDRSADSRSPLPIVSQSGRLLQKLQQLFSLPLFRFRVHFVLCGATTERRVGGSCGWREGSQIEQIGSVMGSVSAFCARTPIAHKHIWEG